MQTVTLQNLLRYKKSEQKLYAILDAGRSEAIYLGIDAVEHYNLFDEEIAQQLAEAAPYLIELSMDCDYSKEILMQEYGNNSMLFIYSCEDIAILVNFFRQYTRMIVDKQEAIFAFYDPRVFHRFMRNAGDEEMKAFFSLVEQYACEESEAKKRLVCYTYEDKLKLRMCHEGEADATDE
jgi:hypothetical protein